MIAPRYNVPGVPKSGIRPAVSRPKVRGSKTCKCGRTISATKDKCAECAGVSR